jgi:anti-sigma regulatory factor (Ser/Thr protein kinase)/ActR/RegA family two-component response regulator
VVDRDQPEVVRLRSRTRFEDGAPAPRGGADRNDTSVLVLGAGPSSRRQFEAALVGGAVSVVETAGHTEGQARLRERPFDLVLLEAESGERAVDRLRALRATRGDVKVIVVSHDSTPEEVLAALREHAFAYLQWPVDADEVAMVVNRALGAVEWEDGVEVRSALPDWVTFRVRCCRSSVDRLMDFLAQAHLEDAAGGPDSFSTAVREILLNAIEHGGGLDPRKHVEVSRIRGRDVLLYHVVDPGGGFSLEGLRHSAVANPPDDPFAHVRVREEMGMRPGGFGILVARRLVDELIYSECGNEVLLVKRIARSWSESFPPPSEA